MKIVFLVEDNEDIRKGLDYLFSQNDFLFLSCGTLKEAREMILTKHYDILILDVTLPDGDGFAFYKEMKEMIHVPVLFLTAKDMEDDIVKGLELGAVDYIVKPFRNRELLMRVHNALRFQNTSRVLHLKNLIVDFDKMQVLKNGEEVVFAALEYKLFFVFLENIDKVVTRELLLSKIWDEAGNYVNDNTLTVYIKRIRQKLGEEDIIKTIKGIGYRMDKE